ncbi:MAG: molybdenum cofactor biosynthesis protein MoaE [Dehalococcoidales bacterium]|nr:molybdenum cofactor biosynthesis protein MoaE [Dehalococcoidales bacterium]
MIEITDKPISPEIVVNKVKTDSSGCVLAYIGLIREHSRGKAVLAVEYNDPQGIAESRLRQVVGEVRQQWQIDKIAICHRVGKLKVGDINITVAVASGHRQEAFAACQYVIDQFKQIMPTQKKETYQDGSIWVEGG